MWQTIPIDKIPEEGKVKRVVMNGHKLCFATINGFIYVLKDSCPHALASLGRGHLEGDYVVCPAHRLKFSMVTGRDKDGIGYECTTYETRFKDNAWQIKLSKDKFGFW